MNGVLKIDIAFYDNETPLILLNSSFDGKNIGYPIYHLDYIL